MPTATLPRSGRHIVVIGAGGNIGSHLVPHLARMPEVSHLTLVDPDRYESHNLRNQAIAGASVGHRKVQVQSTLARRINPQLVVRAIAERAEDVPLGRLRGDVILACLDSRRSRQCVNEIAWRLGVPVIDAGVHGDGLLARIDLYVPGEHAPCLECRWDTPDYHALEQHYPCGDTSATVGGDAPSALGALAAAMQALECQKLLTADPPVDSLNAGDQIVLAAEHHRHFRTAHRRNPQCRLTDHSVWNIEPLALAHDERTLGHLFAAIERRVDSIAPISLSVAGRHFVRKVMCPGCGSSRSLLRLSRSTAATEAPCARCGKPMVVTGFGVTELLAPSTFAQADRDRALRAIGFRDGEVVTAHIETQRRHFELHRAAAPALQTSLPAPMEAA